MQKGREHHSLDLIDSAVGYFAVGSFGVGWEMLLLVDDHGCVEVVTCGHVC